MPACAISGNNLMQPICYEGVPKGLFTLIVIAGLASNHLISSDLYLEDWLAVVFRPFGFAIRKYILQEFAIRRN
jgi:hypothetical protein